MFEQVRHHQVYDGGGGVNLPPPRAAGMWPIGLGVLCSCVVGCSSSRVVVNSRALPAHRRIAVFPFGDAPGADAGHSGKAVAGVIASFALDVPEWTVVEREQLTRVIEEQDLAVADKLIDPETAVKIGKLVGADSVIVGQVMQYRIGSIPFFFLFTFDMDLYKVEYSFRLVSVETGELCLSAHASQSNAGSFEQAISDGATEIFEKIEAALATEPGNHAAQESSG